MKRREVLLLLGGATAAWPGLVHAQSAGPGSGAAHIGILNYAGDRYACVSDFRSELRRLGYIEGQNLTVSHLWADGHLERLPALATELISRRVDLIIALGPSAWAGRDR